MESTENKTSDECPTCGLRKSRPGTVTAWIFQSSYCTCGTSNESRTSAGAVSAKEQLLGDRYKFLLPLGRGGVATVYKVQDTVTDEILAAKVMFTELALNDLAVKRFQKEVDVLADLEHENLVKVRGYAMDRNGVPFLIMQYVEGENLEQLIKMVGPLDARRAVDLFLQICRGLSYVHQNGIIHRDLKPSNVIVSADHRGSDRVTLIDFGFAKLASQGDSRLTTTGEAFGSPSYMSPEQCLGQELDARSDIYSLGCLMYHVLCGKPPIEGENALATVAKQVKNVVASLRTVNPDVPKNLDTVVMKCLEKEPEMRYSNVDEIRQDLAKVVSGKHVVATGAFEKRSQSKSWSSTGSHVLLDKWVILIAVILLVVVSGAVGAWIATRSNGPETVSKNAVLPISSGDAMRRPPTEPITEDSKQPDTPTNTPANQVIPRVRKPAKAARPVSKTPEKRAVKPASRRAAQTESPAPSSSRWGELKKLREFN